MDPRHQEQRRLLINGRDPRALSDNTTVRRAQRGRANKSRTWDLVDHHLEILPAVPHFFVS